MNSRIDNGTLKLGIITKFLILLYFVISFYEGYLNQILGSNTKFLLIGLIVFICFQNITVYINKVGICLFSWIVFKSISILWATGGHNDMVSIQFLSLWAMILFLIVFTNKRIEASYIDRIILCVQIASTSMAVLGLFKSETYQYTNVARQVLTLYNTQIDPNDLSALYIVGVVIGLDLLYEKKGYLALNIISVIAGLITILMTSSRGGLVSVITIVVLIFILSKKKKGIKEIIVNILIITAILAILYTLASKFVSTESLTRIFTFDDSKIGYAIGTGRMALWKYGVSLFLQKPLIGWGWGGYNVMGVASHNTYLSMLLDTGIIGMILFIVPMVMIYIRAFKSGKPLVIMLLLAGLIPSFFIDAINKRFFWNGIILALILLQSGDDYMKS